MKRYCVLLFLCLLSVSLYGADAAETVRQERAAQNAARLEVPSAEENKAVRKLLEEEKVTMPSKEELSKDLNKAGFEDFVKTNSHNLDPIAGKKYSVFGINRAIQTIFSNYCASKQGQERWDLPLKRPLFFRAILFARPNAQLLLKENALI